MKILVSAGEASGDLYASALVQAIRGRLPEAEFFGCTGPRLRAAGVRTIADAAELNVVGLVEVIRHIPRIHGEFRKLAKAARREKPDLAILADSPDFHLRLAPKLRGAGIPVVYLVAPQVWAWRKGRIRQMRRDLDHLLCIFPFEEDYFRNRGLSATYIGHPLTRLVQPARTRVEFFARHGIPSDRPMIVLLPGSRPGEIARHLPIVTEAARRILMETPASFVLASPPGTASRMRFTILTEPFSGSFIKQIEGETWDALAAADLALAASGTVTVEAAILATPMVSFYKVSPWSWWMGRHFVDVPYFTMVNLIAERRVVPELIQDESTGGRLAGEALRLLGDGEARRQMQLDLHMVARRLASDEDPIERAASLVAGMAGKEHLNAD